MSKKLTLLLSLCRASLILILVLVSVFVSGFIMMPGNTGSTTYTNAKVVIKVWKANVALRNNEIDKARKYLVDAFQQNPSDPLLALNIAKLMDCSQSYNTALNILGRSGSGKDNPELKRGKYAWEGYCAAKTGKSQYAVQRTREAMKLVSQIQEQVDTTSEGIITRNEEMSKLLNNLGVSWLMYHSHDKSEGDHETHVTLDSCDITFAFRFFERALTFNPANQAAKANLTYLKKVTPAVSNICPQFTDYNDYLNSLMPFQYKKRKEEPIKNSGGTVHKPLNLGSANNMLLDNMEVILKTMDKYKEIMFVLDHSGSMVAEMPLPPETNKKGKEVKRNTSRFGVMQHSALYLLQKLKPSIKLGAITVGNDCQITPDIHFPVIEDKRKQLSEMINQLYPNGATPLIEQLENSIGMFSAGKDKKAILLFTDGLDSCNPAMDMCAFGEELAKAGIDLFVVCFLLEESDTREDYAFYNCLTTQQIFGATSKGKWELKNVRIPLDVPQLLIVGKIEPNTCVMQRGKFGIRLSNLPDSDSSSCDFEQPLFD
ncbi:MAG: VWA domain-containing protein [Sphingobacteriales bacterium]|nr:MAG: VWA domain-containing protein [Sphingobacteriales bacterium]